jgi:cell wall assembly regulator SMI1
MSYETEASDERPRFCTFPITSTKPIFQEIYICHNCVQNHSKNMNADLEEQQPMPLCICQSCALICHEDQGHDIEYIGSGPSFCDCATFSASQKSPTCSCLLQEQSKQAAKRLGFRTEGLAVNYAIEYQGNRTDVDDFPYTYEVLTLPSIIPHCDSLIDEALELIKHSTDTNWIPFKNSQDSSLPCSHADLCSMEQLAYSILQRHVKQYNLESHINSGANIDRGGGAEWWVQVKYPDSMKEAIDLHYDKDEELASTFDLGSFPTLSTVTYLSDNIFNEDTCAAPTLVFSHMYEMNDTGPIGLTDANGSMLPQLLVSHGRRGKHFVFDGKLLHGAPSHLALRQNPESIVSNRNGIKSQHEGVRVTFLVNVWVTPPAKVSILSNDIREKIKGSTDQNFRLEQILMKKRSVRLISVDSNEQSRIRIPFVSSGATWIEGEADEEEDGLVVSLIPPPKHDDDTIIVKYCEQDLEPQLEQVWGDSDSEE